VLETVSDDRELALHSLLGAALPSLYAGHVRLGVSILQHYRLQGGTGTGLGACEDVWGSFTGPAGSGVLLPANATDIISYNSAISACEKGAQGSRALELLHRLPASALQPDTISYNASISACEKGQQWEKTVELLVEMRQLELECSVITYNALISACEKGLQYEQAVLHLSAMRAHRLQPNLISFNSMILLCVRAQRVEAAFGLLSEISRHQAEPDADSYIRVLAECYTCLAGPVARHRGHQREILALRC